MEEERNSEQVKSMNMSLRCVVSYRRIDWNAVLRIASYMGMAQCGTPDRSDERGTKLQHRANCHVLLKSQMYNA